MARGPLGLTGERTMPGISHENYWFRRHEAVYAAVPGWVPGAPSVVVDAGCGEGYGAAALSAHWPWCTTLGVDYDPAATGHARAAYGGARTAYLRGALTALPLPDGCADAVVSLQVLEHLWSPGDYARELARVCRPGATVVLSTPNRLTFSPGLGRRGRPVNLFHSREYDAEELGTELPRWAPGLEVRAVLGLHYGGRLRGWEARHGSIVAAQLAAPPTQWAHETRTAVADTRADDFVVSPDRLDDSLDLVVVAEVAHR